jgi:hypothetical protein
MFFFYRNDKWNKSSDDDRQILLLGAAYAGASMIDVMGDFYHPSPMEITRNTKAIDKQKRLIDKIHAKGADVVKPSRGAGRESGARGLLQPCGARADDPPKARSDREPWLGGRSHRIAGADRLQCLQERGPRHDQVPRLGRRVPRRAGLLRVARSGAHAPRRGQHEDPAGSRRRARGVVYLILYLSLDDTAFITGSNHTIDGGRSCGARD